MATTRETVKLLCKSILTRLENKKSIMYPPRLRQIVQDEIYTLIGTFIMTDEDLRDKTLAKMGARADLLQDSQFTESDQYKAARAVVRASFGDDVLNGFYYLKSMKEIAGIIAKYMMRSSHIDDVFDSDEDMERQVVETMQKFNPAELH
ncbi:MAG: hypothetical protein A2583_08565 [Bdellovibrionales bacterium RIFOXYD1_FULL_53_11]|nr:MAG: hypothetical protein A2583_08565 [Bdellovibrionales bacterium RIFOXYD1_FULL_53_11]